LNLKNLNGIGKMHHVDGKYIPGVSKDPQNFCKASDLCFNCGEKSPPPPPPPPPRFLFFYVSYDKAR